DHVVLAHGAIAGHREEQGGRALAVDGTERHVAADLVEGDVVHGEVGGALEATVAHFAVAEVVADGDVDIVDGGHQGGAILELGGEHQRIVDAQLDGRDVGGKGESGQDSG